MLGLSLGLGLTGIRGRGRSWSPAKLFADGRAGTWFDPSDLSTLYQDATGTTPVTAPGQPVGLMLDKSGGGTHASQATAMARPIYQVDNGRPYLAHDGVDDYMTVPGYDFGAENFGLVTGLVYANMSNNGTWRARPGVSVVVGISSNGPSDVLSAGVGDPVLLVNNVMIPPGTTRAQLRSALLSVSVASAIDILSAQFNGQLWQVFSRAETSTPAGSLYGYVEVAGMTEAERQQLVAWMARKAGVQL